MSRRALLLLLTTAAWMSFSTVSSSRDVKDFDDLFCDDYTVNCACTVTLVNDSSGVLATVTCENANLTEVPDLRQVGYPVEYLKLNYNQIRRIRRTDFYNQTKLHTVLLSNNLIEEIEDGSFSSTILDSLCLDHNNLSSLPNDTLPTLTRLDLKHNNFSEVPSTFLYASVALEILDLTHNPIKHLKANSFSYGYISLTELILTDCNISYIDFMAFANLYKLKDIVLDYNNLTELNASILAGLPTSLNTFSATHCGIEVLTRDALIGMSRLRKLSLAHNKIERIESKTFRRMSLLREIHLDNNKINFIHRNSFALPQLQTIYLDNNQLEAFHLATFKRQDRLVKMSLAGNHIVTVQPEVFSVIPYLQYQDMEIMALDLSFNKIVEFPALRNSKLAYFHMEGNNFTYIGADAFVNVPNVKTLKLSHNQFVIHNDALKPLINLKEFIMTGNHYFEHLPNMVNNQDLRTLDISYTRLHELPEDLCLTCPELRIIKLSFNYLTHLPALGDCQHLIDLDVHDNQIDKLDNQTFHQLYRLQILNLKYNNISQLPDAVFADLQSVTTIYLQHNNIKEIPTNVFNNTHNLLELNMSSNPVRVMQDGAFHGMEGVTGLWLSNMGVRKIEPHAFPSNMTYLLNLDLSYNHFDNLPIPSSSWPHLRKLYLRDVHTLYEVPTPNYVPELEIALFTYSYHCCAFEPHTQADNITVIMEAPNTQFATDVIDVETFTPSPNIPPFDYTDFCKYVMHIVPFCQENNDNDDDASPIELNRTEIVFVARNERYIPDRSNKFYCQPYSDNPMSPCKYFFGSWMLRILVWLLFIAVIFGNGIVLALILIGLKPVCGSRSYGRDKKTSHLFIFQLAIADIGIGIYLGFLVVVDLKTLSQHNYHELALSWQNGPGCLAAGFFAIFASELSVYTLVVITLERLYVHIYGPPHVKIYIMSSFY